MLNLSVTSFAPQHQPCPKSILLELADLAHSFGDREGCIAAINDLYALLDAAEN